MKPSRSDGRLGRQRVGRQRRDDPRSESQGVDQLARRLTRVDVDAIDGQHRLDRRERLVLQLAQLGAVDRVGAACAEPLDVE